MNNIHRLIKLFGIALLLAAGQSTQTAQKMLEKTKATIAASYKRWPYFSQRSLDKALHKVIKNNKPENEKKRLKLNKLRLKGANLNSQVDDIMGYTPLHLAIAYNKMATILWLLYYGAPVNQPDKFWQEPLMHALGSGYNSSNKAQIVKILLEYGAVVNIECQGYRGTLLQEAVFNIKRISDDENADLSSDLAIVRMLLENGANRNATNSRGETAEDMIYFDNPHTPEINESENYKARQRALEAIFFPDRETRIPQSRARAQPAAVQQETILSPYAILGLSDDAYDQEILGLTSAELEDPAIVRTAYHKLARTWHPDKRTIGDASKCYRLADVAKLSDEEQTELANEVFKIIVAAYERHNEER